MIRINEDYLIDFRFDEKENSYLYTIYDNAEDEVHSFYTGSAYTSSEESLKSLGSWMLEELEEQKQGI